MSDDKKSLFSEKTVVQSSAAPRAERVESTPKKTPPVPLDGEQTAVYAQSNLKETFDARTVVRPAKKTAPPVVPSTSTAAPATVAPVTTTPAATPAKAALAPSSEAAPAVASSETAPKKKKVSNENRHSQRMALDRKTRTLFAALATLCALVVLCLIVALGGPKSEKSSEKSVAAAKSTAPSEESQSTDFASEAPASVAGPAAAQGAYQTTTEVLTKFDRAAQKTQEQALDYSRSGTGF